MKTKRHQLSPAEKTLVVKVYSYFVKEGEDGLNNGRDSRHRTAKATGFGVSTIQRVLAVYNSDPGTNFATITPSTRGHKKKYKESELNALVRQYVVAQNRAMMPVTAQLICNHLEEVLNQDFNARTMRTYLNNMGFKHLRPAKTLTELSSRLTTEFARVKSKHWCKFYRRVLRFERKYLTALEECELVEDDDDDADPEDEVE